MAGYIQELYFRRSYCGQKIVEAKSRLTDDLLVESEKANRAKGEFLGGAFAPGIEISFDALAARAAQLRKVEPAKPRSVIGKNKLSNHFSPHRTSTSRSSSSGHPNRQNSTRSASRPAMTS